MITNLPALTKNASGPAAVFATLVETESVLLGDVPEKA
jgi:hypothetical protein